VPPWVDRSEDVNDNPGLVVCFGELLLRLSAPRGEALLQSARLGAHFGGAEGNVAVALARLGQPSAMISAVSDDALGDAAIESLRKAGVDVSRVRRARGRLGLYFLTPSAGASSGAVIYDRSGSAFASLRDYDWPALLEGATWLHLSGIVPALGPELAEVGRAAIAAAHQAGVRVSFDGNFRGSLWARWCADPGPVLSDYVAGADLLFGNHKDLSLVLGETLDTDDLAARKAFERFPRLAAIASTDREIVTIDHHRLSARIDTRERFFVAPTVEVTGIVDRIGSGDAFAAGVLARFGRDIADAAATGLALAALKHGIAGDHSMATERDLAAFDAGHADVRR
jgi:2-dehydro-3-deoxygluconokinase